DAHWAWQPVQRVTPPEVENSAWCRNEIDRFILSRLEQAGLQPARPAENAIWLRRVTFDLIGLPPTVEEQAAFLADSSVRAEAHVVERLLSAPRFGEEWARHWMDLVRCGDAYGHEFDYSIPFASRYRDYLIRALNDDVP